MRSFFSIAALTLGAATPALAQTPPAAAAAPAAPAPCQAQISKGARPALVALQNAVVAKNSAAVPGLVTAAQAVAKSADDNCFIGQMQYFAAIDAKDYRAASAALGAQRASGAIPAQDFAAKYDNLGRLQYEAKSYADAAASFEQALQIAPNRAETIVMLAETRTKQERIADALPLYQKGIATEVAAGRKPPESWYRRLVAVAYNSKNPQALTLARDWVAAYPTAKNWRDAIKIYADNAAVDEIGKVDLYRLARLNKALAGETDYYRLALGTLTRGFPGEAKAVLEEGFASNAISRSTPAIRDAYAQASAKAAGDRAALEGQVAGARSGGAAKPLMALGEAYYGYGDYAKAADMYRLALTKSGVDASLANLRLGMSLAASGDAAGARTALNAVTGARQEIARYWLTYLSTRS